MNNEYEPLAITVEDALKHILSCTKVVSDTEKVRVEDSLNRVCAEDISARVDVPSFRSSAMDGYATYIDNTPPNKLNIIGTSLPAKPYRGRAIRSGECIKVMTGAYIPESVNAIVMTEDTQQQGNDILVQDMPCIGQHIRLAGEDSQQGSVILSKSKRITPADMAYLYASGVTCLQVYRQPQVSFFSIGDELKNIDQTLNEGEIYNGNSLSLLGMLTSAYCQINHLGIVKDNRNLIEQTLHTAQKHSDIVVSAGGISIDAKNHIKDILSEQGNLHFWRVAIKPGRPFTFGQLHNTLCLALPGNPVSLMATFYLLVLPALRKLSGEEHVMPQRLKAICTEKIHKHIGRSDYQRGILHNICNEQHLPSVSLAGKQESHLLHGMSQANCFIELPRESADQEAGSIVTVIPFSGLLT